jgi:hypothetical protein
MYGDLQGIAGKDLDEIEGLQMTMLQLVKSRGGVTWLSFAHFPIAVD